jgi:hypothetical protein
MRIADQIWTARFKRKIALTPKQSYIVDRAADDELQMWKDHEAWRAAQHLRPLAEKIAHNTQKLQHVNEIGLALLIADDDELLEEAKKWAAMASLNSDCHPRDKDPLSVRRRLRRIVDRATIHTAGILELIGGPLS